MAGDSYTRWQAITTQQLTYAINLILSLSTASLGFAVSLIINQTFAPTSTGKVVFLLSIILFLIAIGLGVWCVINRLRDFRITRKIVRRKEEGATNAELGALRLTAKIYGAWTWRLFWGQISFFALAVLSFIASIFLIYQQKLF
jgi:hypothetical protein